MPFQSCPNIASIAIHGSSNGKQIANLLHAKFAGTYVLTDIQGLATAVAGVCSTSYPALMSDNLLLDDVTVTGLTFVNDLQDVESLGVTPGSASGSPLPANNSLVATLRSALTGRSARGRIYTFPTGTGNVASTGGDLYTTAYATAVQTFWIDVNIAINQNGWTQVILSRFTGGAKRTLGEGFNVTSVEVRNDVADSQRRRLPKGH